MTFINNITGAFASNDHADQGSLVETVLIIAGMAVVAILVVTWIGNAIAGTAGNVANCIAGANGKNANAVNSTCTSDTVGVKKAINDQIKQGKTGRF